MNIRQDQREFLDKHSNLLKENDFQSFYSAVDSYIEMSMYTQIFLDCGISAEDIIRDMHELPAWLFYDTNIQKIHIPNYTTEIYSGCFQKCEKLQIVDLNSVTFLGGTCFKNCTSLQSITLPDTLNTIQFGAFDGTSLKEIKVPKSVHNMDVSTFKDCMSLKKIYLPSSFEDKKDFVQSLKGYTQSPDVDVEYY